MFGVGVGALALVIVLSAFNGINTLVEGLYSSFDQEIRIEAAQGKTFTDSDSLKQVVTSLPEVTQLNRSLEETVLLRYKDSQAFATIKGVDSVFIGMSGLDSLLWAGNAEIETALGKQQLIVGYMVAEKLGLFVQSAFNPVMAYAAKRKGSFTDPNNAFYVEPVGAAGIFAINQEIDAKYVVSSLDFARNLLQHQDQITAYELALQPNTDAEAFKTTLKHLLGDQFTVKTRYEQNAILYKTNNSEKWATFVILAFILLIATFNIIGSLTILILDKKRDTFVLKGMGATPTLLKRLFFTEGLLISLTGGIIGMLLGVVVVVLQQTFGLIPVQGLLVEHYPVELHLSDLLLIFVLVLGIGSVAAYLPTKFILKA